MGDITGVRARPGGRVTLRFSDDSYRALPYPKRTEKALDLVLGDGAVGVSVLVFLLLGGFATYQWTEGHHALAGTLAAVVAPFAVILLIRAVVEIAAHAALVLVLAAVVVLSPLLLIPRVRATAKRWWKREPKEALLNKRIRATEVEAFEPDGKGVAVTLKGQRVRYTADDGKALEREFRAMMSAAPGVGP